MIYSRQVSGTTTVQDALYQLIQATLSSGSIVSTPSTVSTTLTTTTLSATQEISTAVDSHEIENNDDNVTTTHLTSKNSEIGTNISQIPKISCTEMSQLTYFMNQEPDISKWRILMKCHSRPANASLYCLVNPCGSVNDAVFGKEIIEFPIFELVRDEVLSYFPLLK